MSIYRQIRPRITASEELSTWLWTWCGISYPRGEGQFRPWRVDAVSEDDLAATATRLLALRRRVDDYQQHDGIGAHVPIEDVIAGVEG